MSTDISKDFVTLQAKYALRGYALSRSMGVAEGYYVARHGVVKWLSSLDDARVFLAQIGGSR